MKLLLTSTELVRFVSFAKQHWEVDPHGATPRFNGVQRPSSTKKDGREERPQAGERGTREGSPRKRFSSLT